MGGTPQGQRAVASAKIGVTAAALRSWTARADRGHG